MTKIAVGVEQRLLSSQFLSIYECFNGIGWVQNLTVINQIEGVVDHSIHSCLALWVTGKGTSIDEAYHKIFGDDKFRELS